MDGAKDVNRSGAGACRLFSPTVSSPGWQPILSRHLAAFLLVVGRSQNCNRSSSGHNANSRLESQWPRDLMLEEILIF